MDIYSQYGRYHSPAQQYADTSAVSEARTARSETQELRDDLERLQLITEALWNLLKSKGLYEEQELIDEMYKVDMQDGRLDGAKRDNSPIECGQCQRANNRRHMLCIYCGAPLATKPF